MSIELSMLGTGYRWIILRILACPTVLSKLISRQGSKYRAVNVEGWIPEGNPQDIDMSNCSK